MNKTTPYVLSIEDYEGHSGFHLGTDLALACAIAQERFEGRVALGLPVVTVAVLHNRRYGGGLWHSDLGSEEVAP